MKTDEIENGRSGIQVIERAAAILRALKEDPSGMSLGQIASTVGLPRSTVQRIVAALQKERFVIAQAGGGGLRLGPELGALAEATRYNIVEQCRILLSELTQATGETADLSVLRGDTMVFLDQVPGTHRLRAISSVGEVFPLTTTANGRASLALLPRPKAIELAKAEWARQNTEPYIARLERILDDITESGIAYDDDEHTDGISAIGFAFGDMLGAVHAISVPVPTARFARQKANIENALRTTKANVIRMMVS
ncbi:IclR family transcriptional regulator [Planktotalea sp.]|uniref:IclR family transcriptional regulator n=1 Tax=Planktotalea sp. TaxID=2029877 RepID=UPI003D6BC9B9